MSTYDFGKTSFRNYVWLKGGQIFPHPHGLDIEMSTPGAFRLEIYDGGNALARTYRKNGERAGWTTFYFNGSGAEENGNVIVLPPGEYKFKLVNEGAETRYAHQGSLQYA